MNVDWVQSKNGKLIRLTHERWLHIVDNHNDVIQYRQEIMKTVHSPDFIVSGVENELYACTYDSRLKNHLVVIYKESEKDGFIITAFRVRNIKPYIKKELIWKKQ